MYSKMIKRKKYSLYILQYLAADIHWLSLQCLYPRKVSVWQQWTTDLSNCLNDLKCIWSLCHFQVTIHIKGIKITEERHRNSKINFPFAILLLPKVSVILSSLLCTLLCRIAVCYLCPMNITNAAMLWLVLHSALLHCDCCIPHMTDHMDLEIKFQNI
jgi:hypothetical protein